MHGGPPLEAVDRTWGPVASGSILSLARSPLCLDVWGQSGRVVRRKEGERGGEIERGRKKRRKGERCREKERMNDRGEREK